MKKGFKDSKIPPKITKKMSLMYLESFRKFLVKSLDEDPESTVPDLIVKIDNLLKEEGFNAD